MRALSVDDIKGNYSRREKRRIVCRLREQYFKEKEGGGVLVAEAILPPLCEGFLEYERSEFEAAKVEFKQALKKNKVENFVDFVCEDFIQELAYEDKAAKDKVAEEKVKRRAMRKELHALAIKKYKEKRASVKAKLRFSNKIISKKKINKANISKASDEGNKNNKINQKTDRKIETSINRRTETK